MVLKTIAVRQSLICAKMHSPFSLGYVTSVKKVASLVLLPASTECRIELHERERLILLRGDQIQLCREEV